jgi:hypothetical protein
LSTKVENHLDYTVAMYREENLLHIQRRTLGHVADSLTSVQHMKNERNGVGTVGASSFQMPRANQNLARAIQARLLRSLHVRT